MEAENKTNIDEITLNEFYQNINAFMVMCKGEGCEIKANCIRYKINTTINNTYFDKSPIENGSCKYYFEI